MKSLRPTLRKVKTTIAMMGVQTKDDLKSVAHGALRRLLKMPHLVSSFFHTPSRRYACAYYLWLP